MNIAPFRDCKLTHLSSCQVTGDVTSLPDLVTAYYVFYGLYDFPQAHFKVHTRFLLILPSKGVSDMTAQQIAAKGQKDLGHTERTVQLALGFRPLVSNWGERRGGGGVIPWSTCELLSLSKEVVWLVTLGLVSIVHFVSRGQG